ncbi:MAG: prepilin peptidase [Phycisphaeraceae bacterium]|nr:prepilin peptidase [Phycisphaeraceae bacterium]
MPDYEVYLLILKLMWVFFVFAFGACVGSLINVLVYRLPRGLNVVTPPSACPACGTTLTWRENIPVLGWLVLGGKCRFCKSKISARYPIVEAFVGLLFAGLFVLWYIVPAYAVELSWDGEKWSSLRPYWFLNDPWDTWPTFIMIVLMLGALTAMTLIDAETYTIPLELTWFIAILGLVVHTAHAGWVQAYAPNGRLPWPAPHMKDHMGWVWCIATPTSWRWMGAAFGGAVGLAVSGLLLRLGLIRRSFADYDQWEAQARAAAEAEGDIAPQATAPEMWLMYPHARREMFKELVFLSPPIALAWIGGVVCHRWLASDTLAGRVGVVPDLWLQVLAGVLLGFLVGGGVAWGIRILGTIAFGKEAMGLGDVYLMAGVGACLGWISAVLAFFLAAFVGIFWLVIGLVAGGRVQRQLPYGPYLAVATLLLVILKPVLQLGLTLLFRVPAGDPPIYLP